MSDKIENQNMTREEFDKNVQLGQAFARLIETDDWKLTMGQYLDVVSESLMKFPVLALTNPESIRDDVMRINGRRDQLQELSIKMQEWLDSAKLEAKDVNFKN